MTRMVELTNFAACVPYKYNATPPRKFVSSAKQSNNIYINLYTITTYRMLYFLLNLRDALVSCS